MTPMPPDLADMTAAEAVDLLRDDPSRVDEVAAVEDAREGGPRSTVTDAIDRARRQREADATEGDEDSARAFVTEADTATNLPDADAAGRRYVYVSYDVNGDRDDQAGQAMRSVESDGFTIAGSPEVTEESDTERKFRVQVSG